MKITIRSSACAAGVLLLFLEPAAASAQMQSADQQKCLVSVSKAASKLARTGTKEYAKCLKAAAGGTLSGCSAEDCLADDVSGKIADGIGRLRDASDDCAQVPDFGRRHPSLVADVALRETTALFDDILGADLDEAALAKSENAAGAGCQGKIIKAAGKLVLAMSGVYDACRADMVRTATSAADLAACLDAIDEDGQGKIAAAAGGVGSVAAGACADVSDVALGGACAGAGDIGACIEERARCRACRRAAGTDDLDADCDLFDDGEADDSCTGFSGRCNGRSVLCDRPFDDVSYATTHNAYSNDEQNFAAPNQRYGLTRQLAEGVTSMMLDTYEYQGQLWFCHSDCSGGTGNLVKRLPLVAGLEELRDYLEVNPGVVLSIIFESYISEAQVEEAFTDAGLMPYLHAQPVGVEWPTLQQLVDAGTRLVVFTDDSAASLAWHHYVWDFAWETPYSFQEPDDFVCTINRGDMANSLYILNHFLTDPLGSPQLARQVNFNPLFEDRALQCQTESGRLPNFVTVDFYDIGDTLAVVDMLNGFGSCLP